MKHDTWPGFALWNSPHHSFSERAHFYPQHQVYIASWHLRMTSYFYLEISNNREGFVSFKQQVPHKWNEKPHIDCKQGETEEVCAEWVNQCQRAVVQYGFTALLLWSKLPYFHTRGVWSALNGPLFISWDSLLRLARCQSSSKLWSGTNKRTLVHLKTWVSVHSQVSSATVCM